MTATTVLRGRGVLVHDVPWRFVAANRHEFRKKVEADLAAGVKYVVLNLARTAYIDAAGLGVLVSLNKAALECGSRLVLVSATPEIRALLELTKLDVVLQQAPSIAEAKKLLGIEP